MKSNITRFVVVFLIIYFIIVALHQFDGARKIHSSIFCTGEQFVFNLFHPTIRVDFGPYKRIDGVPYQPDKYDYSIQLFSKKKWRSTVNKARVTPISQLNASLDNTAIGPMALFLALLFAIPLGWKRWLIGLLSGIFLLYFMVALKYSFMFDQNLEKYNSTGLWKMLSTTFGDAFRSHEFMLINVAFIWILVAIRMKEIKWFLK